MNNAFRTVLILNATVKEVVADSSRLYLTSLNAMFLAKQVGTEAAGFNTVTSELRRFSHAMNDRMAALRVQIFGLVRQVSELQKLELACRYLRCARERGRRGSAAAGALRTDRRRQAVLEELEASRARFGRELGTALRLCAVGENLAVLAQVEAVGAGSPEAVKQLTHIANEVAAIVAAIQQALKGAAREMNHYEAQTA